MINTIYTAGTGLESYSRGLSVVGENVANLNTTGFKYQTVSYYDLGDHPSGGGYGGLGVEVGNLRREFAQGDVRASGNSLDSAIEGAGFFVGKQGDEVLLSRSGQFQLNEQKQIVFADSDIVLQGVSNGTLQAISLAELQTNPARPTKVVTFNGALNTGDPKISPVEIFAADGSKHTLDITIRRAPETPGGSTSAPASWELTVKEGDNLLLDGVVIRYDNFGNSDVLNSKVVFDYGTAVGGTSQVITLDFSRSNALSNGGGALQGTQDGYAQGALVSISFDEKGRLSVNYSNGQTNVGAQQLAIANTYEPEKLRASGKNMFSVASVSDLEFGTATLDGLGKVKSGSLEASNVELTDQFSELIVSQRAYQASSQVITATNEMLAVLFDIKGRR